jgi:hypothetical protein
LSVHLLLSNHFSQNSVEVYPSNWWVGMKMNKIQLMVYQPKGLSTSKTAVVSNSNDIIVKGYNKPENNHYLFVDIEIRQNAKPGFKTSVLIIRDPKESYTITSKSTTPSRQWNCICTRE